MAKDSRSSHGDECLRRIRKPPPGAAGQTDVVDAGATDDGAAALGRIGALKGEAERSRSRWRPGVTGARRRTDRGDVAVSGRLRLLVTGFGPFPGGPFN